jgi:hypothetical protein
VNLEESPEDKPHSEIHLLLQCTILNSFRTEAMQQISDICKNFATLDNKSKFIWLLSNENIIIINTQFISILLSRSVIKNFSFPNYIIFRFKFWIKVWFYISFCSQYRLSTYIKILWKTEIFNDRPGKQYGNKLRTYRLFKNNFAFESYLDFEILFKPVHSLIFYPGKLSGPS